MSTHVLDTALGRPAAGVAVRLLDGTGEVGAAVTDADGRIATFGAARVEPGEYRLVFDIASYARASGQATFFPRVTITFVVAEERHHHVPLLLSPFAFSTYRGS
ncbi:hydroxyisourate hydrolase [Actinomadura madurae]|uniref:hydroxyisourate hydrolase n=1 Tax=Actinomadura madurae TaxID=1993 RepID=UPI003999EFDE